MAVKTLISKQYLHLVYANMNWYLRIGQLIRRRQCAWLDSLRGFANFFFKISEFTMEVGGWVQVSLGIFVVVVVVVVVVGKSPYNSSKPVLIFWSSIPCVFGLYIKLLILLWFELFFTFQWRVSKKRKVWMGVGGVSSIQVSFGFLEYVNFAKPLSRPSDICFAACPAGCSFCIYDAVSSLAKCVLGQCKEGFVMKYDGTCMGKNTLVECVRKSWLKAWPYI